MPNRIIKESINESKGLSEVSFFAADLYKRLITYADDYGRFNADCQIILARLYPREIGIVMLTDIEDALIELIGAGKVVFYTTTGRKEIYGAFPNWNEHQRIRDSKKKAPEPNDTEVNDYYLRRFIPTALKEKIIERDGFKCCECGKYICPSSMGAKRLMKMGAGLFHIDHIVPVNQGGRATEENLRLLCPRCNLTRQKTFSFDEIVGFAASCGELPQVAASCGELRPNPIQSNTIQSESESESKGHARKAPAYYPDDEELNTALVDFIAHRKKLRKPMSDRAVELLMGKLEKLSNGDHALAVGILNQSIGEGWSGIYPLHDAPKKEEGTDWANV